MLNVISSKFREGQSSRYCYFKQPSTAGRKRAAAMRGHLSGNHGGQVLLSPRCRDNGFTLRDTSMGLPITSVRIYAAVSAESIVARWAAANGFRMCETLVAPQRALLWAAKSPSIPPHALPSSFSLDQRIQGEIPLILQLDRTLK